MTVLGMDPHTVVVLLIAVMCVVMFAWGIRQEFPEWFGAPEASSDRGRADSGSDE